MAASKPPDKWLSKYINIKVGQLFLVHITCKVSNKLINKCIVKHVDCNNSDRWDNTVHLDICIPLHIRGSCPT